MLLLERAKLVVEGGGAVGVAALLTGATSAAERGTTCIVLSGGNVDAGLLASVTRLHESRSGRRLVLFTRVADRPGGLADLLAAVSGAGGEPDRRRARARGRPAARARDGRAARAGDARPRARRGGRRSLRTRSGLRA